MGMKEREEVKVNAKVEKEETKLPTGWRKGYSRSQGLEYYYHAEAKHTQWHFPTESDVANPFNVKKLFGHNLKFQNQIKTLLCSCIESEHKSNPQKKKTNKDEKQKRYGDNPFLTSDNVKKIYSVNTILSSKRPRIFSMVRDKKTTNDSILDSTCIAIIVPYRDLHPEQKRSVHLHRFIPHMQTMLSKLIKMDIISDYHIYIIEQSDDGRKFNRGKLLNIGFDLASKNKYRSHESSIKPPSFDSFVFHDVDLLPCDNLLSYYARFPKKPLHIARVWGRYNNNPKYFGGIVSFSLSDMKRINGYPNTFWGWGGEDDEIQKRCERLGIHWDSPKEVGTVVLL